MSGMGPSSPVLNLSGEMFGDACQKNGHYQPCNVKLLISYFLVALIWAMYILKKLSKIHSTCNNSILFNLLNFNISISISKLENDNLRDLRLLNRWSRFDRTHQTLELEVPYTLVCSVRHLWNIKVDPNDSTWGKLANLRVMTIHRYNIAKLDMSSKLYARNSIILLVLWPWPCHCPREYATFQKKINYLTFYNLWLNAT